MTTIKNHLMTLRTDEPRAGDRATSQPDRVPPGPAMDFSREGSNAHRLYERTRIDQEGDRAEQLARIKKAVEEGTYQPNLEVVAERLAVDLRGGRHL